MESAKRKSKTNKAEKDRSRCLKLVWEDLHPLPVWSVRGWNDTQAFVYDKVETAMKSNKRYVHIDIFEFLAYTDDLIEWLGRVHRIKAYRGNLSAEADKITQYLVIEW